MVSLDLARTLAAVDLSHKPVKADLQLYLTVFILLWIQELVSGLSSTEEDVVQFSYSVPGSQSQVISGHQVTVAANVNFSVNVTVTVSVVLFCESVCPLHNYSKMFNCFL